MAEPFARALAEGDPDMRIAGRLQGEETAVLIDLESELAVEIFRDREIGNSEMKTVDRMNAEFTGTSGRLDGAANGGHGASSRSQSRRGRHDRFARGPLANATAGLPGGQGQRARALPVVEDGLGADSNGAVGSASGAGAATTVGGF